MTTREAVERRIPRWLVLALPDDVDQVVAMVEFQYHTPTMRRVALTYELRKLRREVLDRQPRRQIKAPAALRPSKVAKAQGYRTDATRHSVARKKAYDRINTTCP